VRELEEAWVVQGLVRDDGMTQVEAAHLLGRHKSWICRRLALLEKLSPSVKRGFALGAWWVRRWRGSLTRLPVGNQEAFVWRWARRATLDDAGSERRHRSAGWGRAPSRAAFVLAKPREALARVQGMPVALHDPRLSRAGNWLGAAVAGRRWKS